MQRTINKLSVAASRNIGGDIEVSVVMPCLSEACTVGRCVEKALAFFRVSGVRGEVIIADNGSTDDSAEIASAQGARVVSVQRRGYGSALQAGIAAARGHYIIMGDADDSYDFSDLGSFLDRLRQGDDLVVGNRFLGGIRPGAMPWLHRYVGNPVLTWILNLFFHSSVHDTQCGLRAFRKEAYDRLDLCTTGMEFASEMIVKARLHSQRISEVPIIFYPDGRKRPPHLRSFPDGWRHLRFLLVMCPLWLYLIPSSLLLFVGLGFMVWLTTGPRRIGGITLDIHTMMLASLCVVLGYQTLWYWTCAKMHGWWSGLLPSETFPHQILRYLNLERGLLVSAIFLFTGMGLVFWLMYDWYAHNLGALNVPITLRSALWGYTLMVLGVQTGYGSFFLCMLRMATDAPCQRRSVQAVQIPKTTEEAANKNYVAPIVDLKTTVSPSDPSLLGNADNPTGPRPALSEKNWQGGV